MGKKVVDKFYKKVKGPECEWSLLLYLKKGFFSCYLILGKITEKFDTVT